MPLAASAPRQICQFVPISVKSIRSVYEVIFVRNGDKVYVKIPRVFLREKFAKRSFMKYSSHTSTASGSVPSQLLFSKLHIPYTAFTTVYCTWLKAKRVNKKPFVPVAFRNMRGGGNTQ